MSDEDVIKSLIFRIENLEKAQLQIIDDIRRMTNPSLGERKFDEEKIRHRYSQVNDRVDNL